MSHQSSHNFQANHTSPALIRNNTGCQHSICARMHKSHITAAVSIDTCTSCVDLTTLAILTAAAPLLQSLWPFAWALFAAAAVSFSWVQACCRLAGYHHTLLPLVGHHYILDTSALLPPDPPCHPFTRGSYHLLQCLRTSQYMFIN